MSEPDLGKQLFGLPPRTKVIVGAVMAVAGALACEWLWDRGWIAGLPILSLVLGALLTWTGRQELARERAIEEETTRARAEWAALEEGVSACNRDGRSVARFLQERGYREYGVRRWIAEELAGDTEAG
ncbi:MAG: hypothetical protein HZB39_07305 [Planctomycetes bacterium]|nr:hypothetical protein [Planctomycetota bacterium]